MGTKLISSNLGVDPKISENKAFQEKLRLTCGTHILQARRGYRLICGFESEVLSSLVVWSRLIYATLHALGSGKIGSESRDIESVSLL